MPSANRASHSILQYLMTRSLICKNNSSSLALMSQMTKWRITPTSFAWPLRLISVHTLGLLHTYRTKKVNDLPSYWIRFRHLYQNVGISDGPKNEVVLINFVLIDSVSRILANFRIPTTLTSKIDALIACFFWIPTISRAWLGVERKSYNLLKGWVASEYQCCYISTRLSWWKRCDTFSMIPSYLYQSFSSKDVHKVPTNSDSG